MILFFDLTIERFAASFKEEAASFISNKALSILFLYFRKQERKIRTPKGDF